MATRRVPRRRLLTAAVTAGALAALLPAVGRTAPAPDPTVPAGRRTEPVVLTGADFPAWAAAADVPVSPGGVDAGRCQGGIDDEACTHNRFEEPVVSTGGLAGQTGVPVERLVAYRWDVDRGRFRQVPFQVDEMARRLLSNNNSGFAFYSETDSHPTYVFDREGFRWTTHAPDDPCRARPDSTVAPDPVPGLDTDDELVFMAKDAGPKAPEGSGLPRGVEEAHEVTVADPSGGGVLGYVYVMRAAADGPKPGGVRPYVRYRRDADADVFRFSESSYDNYGAAEPGPWFDPETGTCVTDPEEWRQRRPGDQATITTPRYRFRYEGRWLLTGLQVSKRNNGKYGPDLIDQWKARAFQQRPGGQTPCCGYEEEVNNWGGSSILLGERAGPVRVIRETWGADSGTNVVRREVFYAEEIRQESFLRVHPIPPLDGIYAQWDYNAGRITRYFNPQLPDGVPVDGRDDEAMGNSRVHVGQDGVRFADGEDVRLGDPADGCDGQGDECIDNDVDVADPAFSGVNAGIQWEQLAGPYGTLVHRSQIKQVTPGGAAQQVVAVPYYRDDACFDDGTGSNPGPHLASRAPDDLTGRRCWTPEDGIPAGDGDVAFQQGSIGTHGVHLLLIAESDNAHTTLPLTEIDSVQRIVVLAPTMENVGERYGRGTEKPLVALATPWG